MSNPPKNMASNLEPYKEKIIELYNVRNTTLQTVMDTMKKDFGLSASKSGFERQLKKWGVRKNISRSHRAFLKIKLAERQQQNKESSVYVGGVMLPKLVIDQKASACYVPLTEQYEIQKYGAPEGVVVVTPVSDGYMLCIKTKDLPWIYFLKQLAPIRNLSMLIDMPPETLRAIIPAIYPETLPTNSGHLQTILNHLSATMPIQRDEDIYSVLRRIVSSDYATATTELLKITVYLLSNKLLDYTESYLDGNYSNGKLVCIELLKWFRIGNNDLLLKFILSHKLPTIEAFAEGIFASAVEAEDLRMVKIFLDSGMEPDTIITCSSKMAENEKYTALQFATERNNLEFLKLMLKYDVDVNVSLEHGMTIQRTALQIAARNGNIEIAEILISRGAAIEILEDYESSALQNAALGGHDKVAQMLLDRGADINACSDNNGCPLECAISAKAASLVEMFLERGANANGSQREYHVNTPLQSAIMVGDVKMVQLLLELGADVNESKPEFNLSFHDIPIRTPLQWAAARGNLQLCQVLMEAGADLNAPPLGVYLRGRETTALIAAVSSKNRQLVKHLLQYGADINEERDSVTALETAINLEEIAILQLLLSKNPTLGNSMIHAARTQNKELILNLLEAGADINAVDTDSRSALSVAVEREDVSLVQLLFKNNASPNPKGYNTPLMEAARLGNYQLIDILLDRGAHCDLPGNTWEKPMLTPLQMAAKRGNLQVVQRLLMAGADLNHPAVSDYGWTALQAAVESGNFTLIRFMLDQGADVNGAAAESGITALQKAVARQNAEVIRILLEAGANVNDMPSSDFGSRTPLQKAAEFGDDDLVLLLLDHGAHVNQAGGDDGGRTALQAAVEDGHTCTVQLLLARNADVNAPACSIDGVTALQAAAQKGYLHIADILIKKGANVNAPGSKFSGHTALEFAAKEGRIDMLKLLLNAGADITSEYGRDPLESASFHAKYNGHEAAAKLLKYHQIG